MSERHRRPSAEDVIFWLIILTGIGLAWFALKLLIELCAEIYLALNKRGKHETDDTDTN